MSRRGDMTAAVTTAGGCPRGEIRACGASLFLPREPHCCFIRPTARKELVWSIRKNLYKLSGIEAYQLARDIATDSQSADDLESTDEGGCVDYILSYMQSDLVLRMKVSQLLILNDLVCSIIHNRDTVVITNGVTEEHETLTTVQARTVDHTTLSHANSDTSTTRHCAALPTAVATVQTTQQHTNLSTDTTTQSVDQLQVMHKELGKKLQHYKDMTSTAHSKHHSLSEPTPCQPPGHTPSKVDTENGFLKGPLLSPA